MSNDKDNQASQSNNPKPLTEEKGLQPATNPPQMPQVKPTKQEKSK